MSSFTLNQAQIDVLKELSKAGTDGVYTSNRTVAGTSVSAICCQPLIEAGLVKKKPSADYPKYNVAYITAAGSKALAKADKKKARPRRVQEYVSRAMSGNGMVTKMASKMGATPKAAKPMGKKTAKMTAMVVPMRMAKTAAPMRTVKMTKKAAPMGSKKVAKMVRGGRRG